MQQHYKGYQIITDVGSALNWNRKGFLSILRRAREGNIRQVVVAFPDRLCRAAFPLVRWLLQEYGVELLVHHPEVDSTEAELTNELMATLTVFISRLHGRRSYQNRSNGSRADRGDVGKEERRCSEKSRRKEKESGREEVNQSSKATKDEICEATGKGSCCSTEKAGKIRGKRKAKGGGGEKEGGEQTETANCRAISSAKEGSGEEGSQEGKCGKCMSHR